MDDLYAGLIKGCAVLNGSFLLNLSNGKTPFKEKNIKKINVAQIMFIIMQPIFFKHK